MIKVIVAGAALALSLVGDAVAQDVLLRGVTVEEIAAIRGSGVMGVRVSGVDDPNPVPNPAQCNRGDFEAWVAILLEPERPIFWFRGVERQEIQLMTETVFLAAIGEYRIEILIDATRCSIFDEPFEIPIAVGVSVYP